MESETCIICTGWAYFRTWDPYRKQYDCHKCDQCSGTGRIPKPEKREDQDADIT